MATTAKRVAIFFVILAILGLPATSMADERVVSYTVPVSGEMYFGKCLAQGETVAYAGTLHVVLREDVWTPGGAHQNYHTISVNVKGTGLTTGNTYRFVNMFHLNSNWVPLAGSAWEYTYTTVFKIISQGSGDNEYAHAVTKMTMGPDGTVHTEFQFINEGCRG